MKHPADLDLELFGFYGSFCTQKVQLALAEKGQTAAYRSVNIGPPMHNYEPWYARLNPRMVVPTLRHGPRLICDSAAIIRYIDNELAGPALTPADPVAAQAVREIVDTIDALPIRELSYGRMRGALRHFRDRVVMPRRLRMLRKGRAAAPELAPLYDARITDVEVWMESLANPGDAAAAQSRLETLLASLETRLAQQIRSEFLVGAEYSLADLMATVLYARLKAMGLADLEGYPKLREHYLRMRSRPNFPDDDIVERVDPRRLVTMFAPFLLPRLALLLTAVGLLAWGLVVLLRGS